MKHLRETFTDEEFERLRKVKTARGLNWHDFILNLSEYVTVMTDGVIKVDVLCPKCGNPVTVNVNDLVNLRS